MTCGVYLITVVTPAQSRYRYVGSSKNIERRWKAHKYMLTAGRHHNHFLQHFHDRFGASAVEYSVLEETDPSSLLLREYFWWNKLAPEFNHESPITDRHEVG